MERQRRSFFTEIKREAASLVLDQGYSMIETCWSLDVGEAALRRWVQQMKDEPRGFTLSTKVLTTEQRRIQELEAQIKRLKQEKSILKKLPLCSCQTR